MIKEYYIYIIECANGSLYTGITTDLDRRIEEHKKKKQGAKYTKAFKVKTIRAAWKTRKIIEAKSLAAKLEYQIKRLKRTLKLELIEDKKAFRKIFPEFVGFSRVKV